MEEIHEDGSQRKKQDGVRRRLSPSTFTWRFTAWASYVKEVQWSGSFTDVEFYWSRACRQCDIFRFGIEGMARFGRSLYSKQCSKDFSNQMWDFKFESREYISFHLLFQVQRIVGDELASFSNVLPCTCGSSKFLFEKEQEKHMILFLLGLTESVRAIRG